MLFLIKNMLMAEKPNETKDTMTEDKRYSEVYCLLLGLEHDLESMDKVPIQEKMYLIRQINCIKDRLKTKHV